jgi:predicted RNase H-like HicB family nuclease
MEDRALHVDVMWEEGSYWAQVEEWPGCFATGDTIAELMKALEEAIVLYTTHEGVEPPKLAIRVTGLDLQVGSERELRPAGGELPGFGLSLFRVRGPHRAGPSFGPRR